MFLSTPEAAALLTLSTKTLTRLRATGEGPRFLRFAGRIRYTRADLLEWAVARRQERTPEND